MSAGMTEKLSEALKSGDASKLREAAVEIVGEEPQLDEKDKTIAALKEKLEGQAISSAMSKLAESLADGAGPTVLRLIDRNTLTFNEDYSEVSGLKEAIKAIVKEFPGFGRVAESVVKEEEAVVAAAAAAPAKVAEAVPATPQQLAEAIVAADAAPATAAPAAIGQDVVLRESVGAGSLEATPARLSQLRRYQKSMKAGNVKAMKKHRDLRTRLGL
jgi:phage shock protein A